MVDSKQKRRKTKERVFTWKFINPGDEIELHLLATGIDDPVKIEFGLDGEGIELKKRMLINKSIQSIMCVGDIPFSPEKAKN